MAATGTAALAGDALAVEPRSVAFTDHRVNARTSAEQREVRFVQVTDLHLHAVGRMHRRIADEVNRARPDFVLHTGDAVDRADRLSQLASLLARFDRRIPGYAILGNWEHWANVDLDALAEIYRRANVRLLVNETALHETGGRVLALTGLDDLVGGKPDPGRAFASLPDRHAHVVLAHCPEMRDRLDAVPAFAAAGEADGRAGRIDLVLSGHTHGGQVTVLGWAPMLPPGSGRYVRGWFREAGRPPLYVSRGIGTSMLPVRFGARPEVGFLSMWV